MNLSTVMPAPPFLNAGTVWALIRKDMGALWPYALALALAVIVTASRLPQNFPDILLDFGRSQLHLAAVVIMLDTVGVPIAVAAFIVVLVHQDPATDARQDWMTRPIGPLDIVAAKALVILAVIVLPSAIGNFAYVTTHDDMPIEAATGPIAFTLLGCIFMLVVAWLASSPVQALVAPLVLAVVALLTIVTLGLPLSIGVAQLAQADFRPVEATAPVELRRPGAGERPAAMASPPPAPAPPNAPPAPGARGAQAAPAQDSLEVVRRETALPEAERFEQDLRRPIAMFGGRRAGEPRLELSWPFVLTELVLMLVAASVVLWLLLVRRRVLSARLAFLGFFLGATLLLLLLESSVSIPRDFISVSTSIARPAASEPDRRAAFVGNDANGDNRLDRKEYAAVLDELGFSDQFDSLWAQRDDNGDGFITVDEYRAPIPPVPAAAPAPFTPEPERIAAFAANDSNKDNRLDRWEYSALLDELGYTGQFASLWAQRDLNRDGYVSADEYKTPMQ